MRELETLSAYRVLTRRTVSELNSEGYVLEHKKSGARLFLLSNEDDNKVFSIPRLMTVPEFRIFWSTACYVGLRNSR